MLLVEVSYLYCLYTVKMIYFYVYILNVKSSLASLPVYSSYFDENPFVKPLILSLDLFSFLNYWAFVFF